VTERDPFLRALERDAVIACGCCAAAALVFGAEGPRAALAVLGGGGLAAVSYRAIKGAVDAATLPGGQPAALVKFVTRHAILAIAAYVMLARLRLHPIGLLVGASSLVLAAAAAMARAARHVPPRR
jgi:hypothetical protein